MQSLAPQLMAMDGAISWGGGVISFARFLAVGVRGRWSGRAKPSLS